MKFDRYLQIICFPLWVGVLLHVWSFSCFSVYFMHMPRALVFCMSCARRVRNLSDCVLSLTLIETHIVAHNCSHAWVGYVDHYEYWTPQYTYRYTYTLSASQLTTLSIPVPSDTNPIQSLTSLSSPLISPFFFFLLFPRTVEFPPVPSACTSNF